MIKVNICVKLFILDVNYIVYRSGELARSECVKVLLFTIDVDLQLPLARVFAVQSFVIYSHLTLICWLTVKRTFLLFVLDTQRTIIGALKSVKHFLALNLDIWAKFIFDFWSETLRNALWHSCEHDASSFNLVQSLLKFRIVVFSFTGLHWCVFKINFFNSKDWFYIYKFGIFLHDFIFVMKFHAYYRHQTLLPFFRNCVLSCFELYWTNFR